MSEQEVELTADEQEEQDYLNAFKEVSEPKSLSADDEVVETGGSDTPAKSPDNEDQDAGGDKPPVDGTASDVPSEEAPDPYAWINALPEDVQKQAKALQHRAASSEGRVSAYQRRNDELELQAQAKAQTAAGRQPPSKSTSTEDKDLSPKLKEFVDTYPALAESVHEMVSKERTELEELINNKLAPLQEESTLRELKQAHDRLEQGASDIFDTANSGVHYKDVLKSDLYAETFLRAQPAEFQRMATTTSDPDTALFVLEQFATFAEKYAKDNGLMDDDEDTGKSNADKTNERREANKQNAGKPTSRSAVTDPDADVDYEALFKSMNS